MTKVKYLICTAIVLSLAACAKFENETKTYIELDELKNTLWYSYDKTTNIYYNVIFSDKADLEAEGWFEGSMDAYDSPEYVNRVEEHCHNFTYNFTKATSEVSAIVKTKFENGKFYDGYVIPKGVQQINEKDVFIIQLFEVDKDGNLIMADDGVNYQSTIMMIME